MNAQLKKIGMGLALLALPLFATTANAQWSQSTGVNVNLSDAGQALKTSNTVLIDQYGTLNGHVASINSTTRSATGLSGLNVFLVKNKQVVKQTQTQADGSFSIRGLNEGIYSFYAAGQNGFAAYGIYATRQNDGSTSNLLEATTASAVYPGVLQMVQQNVPSAVAQSIASAASVAGENSAATTKQVQLNNGRLHGTIRSLFGRSLDGTQVHLINNDQPVAQVYTDARGAFSIPDVAPGVYDLIVVGTKGLAATRFEAVGPAGPIKQVAFTRTAAPRDLEVVLSEDNGNGAIIGDQGVDYASQNVIFEPSYNAPVEYASESIVYGGAAGCSAPMGGISNVGGGVVRGRFGGLGRGAMKGRSGLSRMLFLGGVAGGVVAIADGDSDDASPNGN